jgi:hypothetical protein
LNTITEESYEDSSSGSKSGISISQLIVNDLKSKMQTKPGERKSKGKRTSNVAIEEPHDKEEKDGGKHPIVLTQNDKASNPESVLTETESLWNGDISFSAMSAENFQDEDDHEIDSTP